MIRLIAAIDDKRGLADDHQIPWPKPKRDLKQLREKTMGCPMLMGFRTYLELTKPLQGRTCYVVTDGMDPLREGFMAVTDLDDFMKEPPENLWLFGGAGVFAQTMQYAEELHLTHIQGDWNCTKFLPPYKDDFELVEEDGPYTEDGVTFKFAVYRRKS